MLWRLFLSCVAWIDAEKLHRIMVGMLQLLRPFPALLRLGSGTKLKTSDQPAISYNQILPKKAPLGFSTLFPLGLAAGFDKDAEILDLLPSLGFGFAEIGTVTPRPQSGNPRPRLYRFYRDGKIFNRMGFNNLGARAVSQNVEKARKNLPAQFGVGVNLGKNKESEGADIARDYSLAAEAFKDLADYFVINVSSPNTPGLRALQDTAGLLPILMAVQAVVGRWNKAIPIYIKLAPEIGSDALSELLQKLEIAGASGFVLGNTLAGKFKDEGGGFSGTPLTEIARKNLQTAKAATSKPIISVGGITSVEEAKTRLAMGASAIQIYTSWIMNGPKFPSEICKNI